ncbi:MAG: hypothetical protein PHS05_03765, partial [Bacteroidales bacterium]|nr:hypothetical protein [Bacteroidales bacterium]
MDKQRMRENAKKSIDDLFLKIEELENKRDKVSGDLRIKFDKVITDLKHERDKLNADFDKFQKSTEKEWGKHKETF